MLRGAHTLPGTCAERYRNDAHEGTAGRRSACCRLAYDPPEAGAVAWYTAACKPDRCPRSLRLSRFKLAKPPTPRDTEVSNAYAIIHDSLGPVCICSLIGINSIVCCPCIRLRDACHSGVSQARDPLVSLFPALHCGRILLACRGREGHQKGDSAARVRLTWSCLAAMERGWSAGVYVCSPPSLSAHYSRCTNQWCESLTNQATI